MEPLDKLAFISSWALGFTLGNFIFVLLGLNPEGSFGYFIVSIILTCIIRLYILPKENYENIGLKTGNKKPIKKEIEPVDEWKPTYMPRVKVQAKRKTEPVIYEKPKPSKPNALVVWFSENTLAKVGGLLIFLAILAFLSVIYTQIGPVGRLIISVLVSLTVYCVGVYLFTKKSFIHEAQIVLGVGVVALYLSILYIFHVPVFLENFGEALPYIVLGLLTVAVIWGSITGMIFASTSLFAFSIVIAYINPFLIGVELTTIQLLAYIVLISGGAMATAWYLIAYKKDETLGSIVLHIAFWGGLILALTVVRNTSLDFNSTLVVIVALTAAACWVASLMKGTSSLSVFLISGGIGLFLTMIGTSLNDTLGGSIILGLGILALFGMLSKQRNKVSATTLMLIFILPLLMWIVGYFMDFWFLPVVAFGGMIVVYAILFLIFEALPTWFSSILFILFGLVGLFFAPGAFGDISTNSRYLLMAIGVFLFAFGHYFTLKRNISVVPVIHTLTSLGLLVVNRPGADPVWAILTVGILAIATMGISLYSYDKKLQSALDHICVPLIGAASLVSTLLYFGTIKANWGIALGGIFIIVAVMYVGGFITILKPLRKRVSEYMTVTFLGIATSILTLAVAYLFSGNESAKTLAWIIEASLIFTVYARYSNPWILAGAIVVQIVSMGQFVMLAPSIPSNLTVFIVVLAASFWNIWSLRNISTEKSWGAEIVHFVSTGIWYGFLVLTLSAGNSWSSGNILLLSGALIMLHTVLLAHSMKKVYFSGIMIVSVQFFSVWIELMDTTKWVYFIAPFLLFFSQYYFAKKQIGIFSQLNWFLIGIGVFMVSSYWVDNHFTNVYILTIWWSLWIGVLLTVGMKQNISILRSLGLMIYVLTLGKILLVDLGRIFTSSGGSGVYIGIGIIMLLGIVSIGLSMLYKKLMGDGALQRDFLFQNATEKKGIKS